MRLRARNFFNFDVMVIFVPLIAVLLAFTAGGVILLALGANPFEAYGVMIDGAFGTPAAFFRVVTRATPLLLVAIGICVAFRGGMVNIGGEGQLFVGAIASTAFSLAAAPYLPAGVPLGLATLVIGFLAGAAWGFVPGFLKARFEVNEILSTVMMNEIAIQLLFFLLSGPMIDPQQVAMGTRIPQSAQVPEGAWLLELEPRSQLHIGIFIAVALAIIVWVLLWRTTIGYRIRAVGLNRDASRYAGIPIPVYLTLALVISGGLAGMAGATQLLGVEHRMVEGFAVGYGFAGIVVALFGRLHPLGAIPSAVLFGALLVGADKMQRTMQIPSATVTALQGLVVIFVVSSELLIRRWRAQRQARAAVAAVSAPEVQAASGEAHA